MPRSNLLLRQPPAAVVRALVEVGAALRLARVRRGWSRTQLAERIGTGVRAIADVESGKPATAIGITLGMLWALGLLEHYAALAEPSRDVEGERLARARERTRARTRAGGDDRDF
jgi:transcriptional regulator with XRE-family HTH domain